MNTEPAASRPQFSPNLPWEARNQPKPGPRPWDGSQDIRAKTTAGKQASFQAGSELPAESAEVGLAGPPEEVGCSPRVALGQGLELAVIYADQVLCSNYCFCPLIAYKLLHLNIFCR